MSGSTIGGVVGGVIGFVVSGFNPAGFQVGWMIGSAVGGYIDPDVIKGPRLKDAQTQTSMEGAPRPIVYGTVALAGNVIQCGPLVEHKKRERTGKGGPVQETYSYTRDYAIRVCEGPVGGITRIWRDDRLVYDVRSPADWPDEADAIRSMSATSAKFSAKLAIYLGDEAQLPDPTLEALPAANGGGVGNVPAYRGTCYVVIADDDLTERGGSIPVYRFEVASSGTFSTIQQQATVGAQTNDKTLGPDTASAYMDYNLTGVRYWDDPANGCASGTSITTGVLDDSLNETAGIAVALDSSGGPGDSRFWSRAHHILGPDTWSISADNNYGTCELYQNSQFVAELRPSAGDSNSWWYSESFPEFGGLIWFNGSIVYIGVRKTNSTTYNRIYAWPLVDKSGAVSESTGWSPVITAGSLFFVHMDRAGTLRAIAQYEAQLVTYGSGFSETRTALPMDLAGMKAFAVDSNILILWFPGSLKVYDLDTFTLLQTVALTGFSATENHQIIASENSLFLRSGQYIKRLQYSAYCLTGAPEGWNVLPDQPGYVSNGTSILPLCATAGASVTADDTALSEVVSDLCQRVGVTIEQVDVSALTDTVRGFIVGRPMPAADAIRSLQQGYFFDFPEWDLKLRGIKRGGPSLFTITDDDLVESDDDEDTRAQVVEFPRKLNLVSPDPSRNYESPKETAARRTDNIKAIGEMSVELPLSQMPDERAQTADKMLRIAWAEAEGRCEFQLPEEFTAMTPSDPFTKDSKRWRANRVEYGDGVVKVEATRDRVSAYTSSATGGTGTATPPVSALRGPTRFVALNLPSLRSSDNVPGMYLAACGVLSGWIGADIYLSTDGGATEQLVATILDAAIMGTLYADLAVGGATLSVTLYNDDTLETATDAQLAARQNGFAITSSGVSEVGQFKTATDAGDKRYDLTTLTRGALGTTEAAHVYGDSFVVLDGAVLFLPIDQAYAGQTLIFRAVSRGTDPENNPTTSVVYETPTFIIDGGGA